MRFGYRAHVIVRATEEEARAATQRLTSRLEDDAGERIRRRSLDTTSAGNVRQTELRDLADDDGYVEDNLWTGIGRESFILSGYPHLAEADLFPRHVLARLEHGPLPRAAPYATPAGSGSGE
jgi:alkanesulfonate monooxygenase